MVGEKEKEREGGKRKRKRKKEREKKLSRKSTFLHSVSLYCAIMGEKYRINFKISLFTGNQSERT